MAKTPGVVETPIEHLAAEIGKPDYRAITQGGERDQWAVVDDHGSVVYRGDARVAAMIASRLTRTAR